MKPTIRRYTEEYDTIAHAKRRYILGMDWSGKFINSAHFWTDRSGKRHCWLRLNGSIITIIDER